MANWVLDTAHSRVEFSVRHMLITTVKGHFDGGVSGKLVFDETNPANSQIEATVETGKINSGVADRDAHLRSNDFFNAEQFPTLTFKSTKIEVGDENTGKITGDLTIRDVTKSVVFDVEYFGSGNSPFGDFRSGFTGSTKVNREDWGLTWNMAVEGGQLVGKEIKITVDLEAIRQD
jgi:polyisoprenoid-binding protein YceI